MFSLSKVLNKIKNNFSSKYIFLIHVLFLKIDFDHIFSTILKFILRDK